MGWRRIIHWTGGIAATLTLTLAPQPAPADALDHMTAEERGLAAWVHADRAWHGAPPILLDGPLTGQAQLQAARMAATGQLAHSPLGELAWWTQQGWNVTVTENVAVAGTVAEARAAVLDSPPHLANELDSGHRGFGVAVRRDPAGRVWVAWVFGGFR